MSSFKGGPADGVGLMLRSAPPLLRVTGNPRAKKHQFDALDQPEDEPKPHERLYLYERVSEPFPYHVSARGKGASAMRGVWTRADYRYALVQPSDETMRSAGLWNAYQAARESL